MKAGFLLLMPLLSAGSLLSGADPVQPKAEATPVTAPRVVVPKEITQYYHDVNFAACFSTPDERTLVGHMTETSETDKLSARLQTLTQAVRRIRAASVSIDPHMVHGSGDSSVRDEELTEIVAVQRSGSRIQISVCTRTVAPKTVSWLVADFEKAAQKTASVENSAVLAEVLKQTPRREIHTWNCLHGRWMREEAAVVPLKSAGR